MTDTTPPRFLARWAEGEPLSAGEAAIVCIELRGLHDIAEHYDDEVVVGTVDAIANILWPLHQGLDRVARLDEGCLLIVLNSLSLPEAMYLALRTVDQLRAIQIPGAVLADLACVAVVQMSTGQPLSLEALRREVLTVSGTERVRILQVGSSPVTGVPTAPMASFAAAPIPAPAPPATVAPLPAFTLPTLPSTPGLPSLPTQPAADTRTRVNPFV